MTGSPAPGALDAWADELAHMALSLAAAFTRGATMWCVAPAMTPHARHLAVEFVHPVRVIRMRSLTLTMTFLWGVFAILALAADLRPGTFVSVVLAIASLYLAGIGAFLQATREEFG